MNALATSTIGRIARIGGQLFFGRRKALPGWEPDGLYKSEHGQLRLAHVAAFAPKGSNAGDILLPGVLRDLFSYFAGPLAWDSVHAHGSVENATLSRLNATQGVVVGGGGLFLRDTNPNNVSGWQWPIAEESIRSLDVPLCLFAVGYNRFRGQVDFDECFSGNLIALAEKSVFLGLRNHGSISAVRELLPDSLKQKVVFQPCMTTLISTLYKSHFEVPVDHSQRVIALNCAFDRSELRFGDSKRAILRDIATATWDVCKKWDCELAYYRHFAMDDEMTGVLHELQIPFRLCDLSVAGFTGIIDAYRQPLLAIGMRGHAQMIPFGCSTAILSLISHNKVRWFLDDIDAVDWGVDLQMNANSLRSEIFEKANSILQHRKDAIGRIEHKKAYFWDISKQNVNQFMSAVEETS